MAAALVQHKAQSTGSVGAQTVTFDAPLTVGNFLCAGHVGNSESVTYSIANNGDGVLSWQTIGPLDYAGATAARGYIWYAQINQANITTVTITRSSGTATIALEGAEFSGIATSSELAGSDHADTAAATAHDVATGVTLVGPGLLFCICGSTTSASYTPGTNYTGLDSVGSLGAQYRVVGSGGTYTSPINSIASETCKLMVAGFNGVDANVSISGAVGSVPMTGQIMGLGLGIGMPDQA